MGIFGRSDKRSQHDPLENVIGPSATWQGTLRTDGGVRIEGAFEGIIECAGNVVIAEDARVVAEITARNVTVGGAFKGSIDGTGRLEILSTGQVFGDISVASVMIDEGGVFQGASRMRGLDTPALTAPLDDAPADASADADAETDDDGTVDLEARPVAEPVEDAAPADDGTPAGEADADADTDAAAADADDEAAEFDELDIEPVIPDVVIEEVDDEQSKGG